MEFESGETRENPKESAWRQTQEEVDRIVDKLGKHVDSGIKESVVALKVLGLETDGSCEGHLGHGIAGPWIDVGQVPASLSRRMKEVSKAGAEYDADTIKEMMEVNEKLLAQFEQLMVLLGDFYKDREVPFDRRLILHKYPSRVRLLSQGTPLQEYHPAEIQAARFERYREEMLAFATFLKGKFFS